jgi:eukaryotic-like serine/threonine-protein kinase
MSDPSLLAGRYRLLERRDRTGTSWRSHDELLHRDVTISEVRLPPPGPHRDELLSQVRATAGLRHPGIITLHDVIFTPDRMWLITESIEGRSLIQTVRADGPFAPERAAEIGLRVLDALTAAHEQGVRLVATPDAVLLAPGDRIVLTGIASTVPAGELRDLGVILFAAVEGRLPGTGSHPGFRLADGTSLADPDAGSTGSGPLTPLLEELLTTEPVRRPDAASVRSALERIAPHPTVSHRKPLITAAVTAVLLLAGALFWLWPSSADLTPPVAEPTPQAEPPSFDTIPRPCGLLSEEQLAKLYLASDHTVTEDSTECSRGPADSSSGQTDNLRHHISYGIRIFPRQPGGAERQKAHGVFASNFVAAGSLAGTDADGSVQTPPTRTPGIGQEAYTRTIDTSFRYTVRIVFRVSNLLVTLHYHRGTGPNSSGQTEKGAAEAAKWIAEALARKN